MALTTYLRTGPELPTIVACREKKTPSVNAALSLKSGANHLLVGLSLGSLPQAISSHDRQSTGLSRPSARGVTQVMSRGSGQPQYWDPLRRPGTPA